MTASSAARSFVSAKQALRLVEQPGVLERDAHARGKRAQQTLVGLRERVLLELLERDHPGHPIAAHDRDAEERLRVRAADLDGTEDVRLVVRAHPYGAGGLDDAARQARPELTGRPRSSRSPCVDRVRELDRVRGRVVERDEHRLRVEDRADPLADQVDDRLELELLGERRADLVDDRQLGRPLIGLGQQVLRLVEQPGVLEGDAEARGERVEESLVGFREGIRLEALETDRRRSRGCRPGSAPPSQDWVSEPPTWSAPAASCSSIVPSRSDRPVLRTVDVIPGPTLISPRWNGFPSSWSYGNVSVSRSGSWSAMNTDRLSKIVPTRSPTRSMIAWNSSCRASAAPISLITDSSAARSFGLGEEALRLVEEPGVLEGDAHARGERAEQPFVGFAERVWPFVLERDDAKHTVAGDDRDAEPRLRARPGSDHPVLDALLVVSADRSGRLVAITSDVRPSPKWIGSLWIRSPRLTSNGNRMRFVARVVDRHEHVVGREDRARPARRRARDRVEVELLWRAPRRSR